MKLINEKCNNITIPPWSVIFHTLDEFYLTPNIRNHIEHVKPYEVSTTC